MSCLTGYLPFSYLVEAKDLSPDTIYHIRPSLEQISSIMLGSDEVEIKAVVNLSIIAFEQKSCKVITDMSVSEIDYENMNQLAGIVGYIVQEEDTLWNIAKRYYTTIDSIRSVNQLDRDELSPGQKLILVKG
jgi:nucleoid-associated protein YgaU